MRRLAPLLVSAFGVAAWLACVGDNPNRIEPDPNVPAGQFKGACRADNTCDPGLECSQGVCLYPPGKEPDAGVDGAPIGDAGPDGDGSCAYGSQQTNVPCPGNGTCPRIGDVCCTSVASNCVDAGVCSTKAIGCRGTWQDGICGGQECCLEVSNINLFACPAQVTAADFVNTYCAPGDSFCPAQTYVVCRDDSECFEKACLRVAIAVPGLQSFELGICR